MIEIFEVDDIVTTKRGKKNPQREADARALRTVKNLNMDLTENAKILAIGDKSFDPKTKISFQVKQRIIIIIKYILIIVNEFAVNI
ncbi:hypothetical protein [Enterococcus sp. OL5]|uniref:hypothetical protein n=1 Tax=Enterococcus sp. OL5 TaxID=2590214 RepID=UPI00112B6E48|nr:hypothetical protein [Enterococcus sp. OL5]TPR55439.1 hypothetical protein FJU10_16810 [Enterococcus sp. OL5]